MIDAVEGLLADRRESTAAAILGDLSSNEMEHDYIEIRS
jgi:hypothetical protein